MLKYQVGAFLSLFEKSFALEKSYDFSRRGQLFTYGYRERVHVDDFCRRFRNTVAIGQTIFYVKCESFPNVLLGLARRFAAPVYAGNIGNVGPEVLFLFNDDDRIFAGHFHPILYHIKARTTTCLKWQLTEQTGR